MASVITCYKWVIDEKDIRINPDRTVDMSRAQRKISEYDKNAIEVGIRIANRLGARPVGLTFGGPEAKQSLKDALSRGLEAVYWVGHPLAAAADGMVTARVLAAAAQKIGDYNVIVCAEGAGDTYARQVGPRLGALLDLPVITAVCEVEVDGQYLVATRKLEDYVEKVKVSMPAVICVLPEICEAPVPTLKAVLAAGKKPAQELTLQFLGLEEADLPPGISVTGVLGYVMNRKNIILKDGDVAARVKELVAYLKKEGVI